MSTLACLSPADYADPAEGMQQAALSRRERQVGVRVVNVVSSFWVLGFVCVICEISGRHWGFVCAIYLEYSYVNILPQMAQITQRNAASCIISQRKTVRGGVIFVVIAVLLFLGSSALSARSAGDIGVSFVEIT